MSEQRKKYLQKIQEKKREKLELIIEKIISGEFQNLDVKELNSNNNYFRCRTWNIRIIFEIKENQIKIIKIWSR